MQAVTTFFHALAREFSILWDLCTSYMVSVFDPQSGWPPKAIFGAVLLVVVFWVAKRGTKS